MFLLIFLGHFYLKAAPPALDPSEIHDFIRVQDFKTPPASNLTIDTVMHNNLLERIKPLFLDLEALALGKNGLLDLTLDASVESALYDPGMSQILISVHFIESIEKKYLNHSKEIFYYVLAHEISHFVITNYCNSPEIKLNYKYNYCSSSVANRKDEISDNDFFYELRRLYNQEHIIVDEFARYLLIQLGMNSGSQQRIATFIKSLDAGHGFTKRMTELYKQDLENRSKVFIP